MRRATFLASVRGNLREIQVYIARESGSRSIARGFAAELRRRCHELAALPGTARAGTRPAQREPQGHAIFFRYEGGRFEVVNILEGHRDSEAYFRNEAH